MAEATATQRQRPVLAFVDCDIFSGKDEIAREGLLRNVGQYRSAGVAPLFVNWLRQRADLRLHALGFIFQAYNLFPVLTAQENVQFVLELQGVNNERGRRAREDAEEHAEREARREGEPRPRENAPEARLKMPEQRPVQKQREKRLADCSRRREEKRIPPSEDGACLPEKEQKKRKREKRQPAHCKTPILYVIQ